MKTIFAPFLLIVFFLFTSCSASKNGPFFWAVEKEEQTLHILGTVHIGVSLKDLQCSEVIYKSLQQSDLLWTETDTQKHQKEIKETAKQLLEDTSGQSFQSLSEETQTFFKTKTTPETFKALQQMSYFGLIWQLNFLCIADNREFLREQLSLHARKIDNRKKLDIQIQKTAQNSVLQDYLDESGYFQDLIQSIAKRTSKEKVERVVKDYNERCSQENLAQSIEWQFNLLAEAIQEYEAGEDVNFLKIDEKNLRQRGAPENIIKNYSDHFIHNILRRRNEIWLNKLLSSYEQEGHTRVFIAAGFAHFKGPFNMLDMLQKEGFSIKRLDSDCKWNDSLISNTEP